MRYLDPKADLTFKKVFGEHSDILISFLNAMLPLAEDELITEVTYMTPELVPQTPLSKNSIVDVRCKDVNGQQFIVEMQMMWTSEYKKRVLFNASKAYVSQLDKGEDYSQLQPVYSLNLLNDTYTYSDRYYHYYRIVEDVDTNEVIEGLRFVFVELPKFTPRNYGDKKMQVLWLRYLTEIGDDTLTVPEELTEVPEIGKAVTQLEESAFTKEQLVGYDKFWDIVSTAKTTISSAFSEGKKEGREEGLKEGREEGIAETNLRNARAMKEEGIPDEIISKITGLSIEDIKNI